MVITDHGKNDGSNSIPRGWQLKSFGDLFEFSGGFSASRDQLSEFGHCYLHYGDIHGSNKSWIDTNIDLQDIPKLNIPLKRISPASLLKDGDVVFVDASEDDEGTSKHIVVSNKSDIPFISGLHTIVAKSKTNELTHEYRRYCFQSDSIKQQFLFYAVGTKVSGISKSNIRNILIAVPPIDEQHQISRVLIDIDALLARLDITIMKKRDMKQAAMQHLLIGKTRLPGFTEKWQTACLGDLSTMGSGGTPLSSVSAYYDGDIPWVSISDMTNTGKVISTTSKNLTKEGLKNSAAQIFPPGTVLYAMYASLGECSIAGESLCTSQAILGIQVNNALNNEFLYYWLISLKNVVKTIGQQGTQSNLNKGMVQGFRINLPPLDEQKAIAKVLSDMDDELLKLEDRRNKTKQLKQAMMQKLLTGKTRLIDEELNNA